MGAWAGDELGRGDDLRYWRDLDLGNCPDSLRCCEDLRRGGDDGNLRLIWVVCVRDTELCGTGWTGC